MAWDNAKQIFPQNEVLLPDATTISIDDLQHSEIKTLFQDEMIYNQEALIGLNQYVWGANGEYAYIKIFDIFNLYEHPNDLRPLNYYGTCMVNDYLVFNNINTNDGIKTLF